MNTIKNTTKISLIKINLYLCLICISIFMMYSGINKIVNIYQFINTLDYYKHIPSSLHFIIGYSIPIIEILIGLLIWFKNLRNIIVLFYILIIVLFIIILVIHYGSYMPEGCGCFGAGRGETINYILIGRDFLLTIPGILFILFRNIHLQNKIIN
ncbi:MauE/DoxX family redox-associated membrane protein [Priestia megaterium]|uniref:MauE/DoxX family redox-associated membrane protein n=1 Tax=Priestia megaterium TaxID=1404 RepID=UPI000E2E6DF4|nr:hypothetical protein DZB86_29715 [Bacillus sp. RC]